MSSSILRFIYLPEEDAIPKGYKDLCRESDIIDSTEGAVIFIHTLMLEVGFIPKDIAQSDVYKGMPKNWRGDKVYNISYYHKTIPDVFCFVSFTTLYSDLLVYGLLEDETNEENKVRLKFEYPDMSTCRCQIKIRNLVIRIKDGICFPLLALLQQSVNFTPLFGLSGLNDDCKLVILKKLPVESLTSISRVNKEFHKFANSPYMWKHLFKRDFGSGASSGGNSSSENWKEKYKQEYLKRNPPRRRSFIYQEGGFTLILPSRVDSPWQTCPYSRPTPAAPWSRFRDLDPALQQAFPHLRNRLHHSTLYADVAHFFNH